MAAALCLLAFDFARWWLTSETFALHSVDVAGSSRDRCERIARDLADLAGSNIWRLSPQRVLERVRAHPWVDRARVHIVYPDVLRVSVQERIPVAQALDIHGRPVALDGAGYCFELASGAGYGCLPLIEQLPPEHVFPGACIDAPTATTALAVSAQLCALAPTLWAEIAGMRVTSYEELVLCTTGPLGEVYLPPPDAPLPVAALLAVRERLAELAIACVWTDFRSTRGLVAIRPVDAVAGETLSAGSPARRGLKGEEVKGEA
jgi:hypothetical protein